MCNIENARYMAVVLGELGEVYFWASDLDVFNRSFLGCTKLQALSWAKKYLHIFGVRLVLKPLRIYRNEAYVLDVSPLEYKVLSGRWLLIK